MRTKDTELLEALFVLLDFNDTDPLLVVRARVNNARELLREWKEKR